MSLIQDLQILEDVVKRTDPSFAAMGPGKIDAYIQEAKSHASENAKDYFLLSAMRLMALPGNGHTRLIPNDAISVLPLRFVTIGNSVFLTKTAPQLAQYAPAKLIAVNGIPVTQIERAATSLLAGTPQRQRVIGPLLFAWPAALAHLGCAAAGQETTYHLQSVDGRTTTVSVPHHDTVPASDLYPKNEHGQADPDWTFKDFAQFHKSAKNGLTITLPSFFDPEQNAFPKAIEAAAKSVHAQPNTFLLVDVRGNTGGNFLLTLPLIEAICQSAEGRGCAVLVDKFTFSAAIVFVALLKYRLGQRLKIIGEEMGDRLKFYAEGGLIDLPASGAHLRYSTALHDWETGTTDETTPPEIAQHLVPVQRLQIDREWVSTPFDTAPRNSLYNRIIEELA